MSHFQPNLSPNIPSLMPTFARFHISKSPDAWLVPQPCQPASNEPGPIAPDPPCHHLNPEVVTIQNPSKGSLKTWRKPVFSPFPTEKVEVIAIIWLKHVW